jgi:hypothetical protein
MKKPLFWEMFFLLALVGVLNYIATLYDLYWSLSEFDSVVHFFGGATLGAFFLWFYFFSGFFAPPKRKLINFLLAAIFSSMFVAVSWEIYELLLGEAIFSGPKYGYDTSLDLFMDFLGVLATTFYAYMKEVDTEKDERKN